jgi:hypothetical protein
MESSVTPPAPEERLFAPLDRDRGATGWLVVFGSTLALIVGNGPIILFPFGVLRQPISAEFGWQRSVPRRERSLR